MYDLIDKVVYINLDERADRKTQVQRELLRAFPAGKIVRFPAIKHADGGRGCTMSHIAVLEMAKANAWKNVLIVEDDFVWIRLKEGVDRFTELLSDSYDVIVVGGAHVSCNTKTMRLASCQTTTAYVVAQHYYDTLLGNYREGLAQLEATNDYGTYALDQFWKRLQGPDNWFIVLPIMAAQRPGYSDIEKRNVNYIREFAVVR